MGKGAPTTRKEHGGDMAGQPGKQFGDSLMLFGVPVPTREGMSVEEVQDERKRIEVEAVIAVTQASGLRMEDVKGCVTQNDGEPRLVERKGEVPAHLEVILKMTFRSTRGALTAFQRKWKVSCLEGMLAGTWLQEDLRKPEREMKKERKPY